MIDHMIRNHNILYKIVLLVAMILGTLPMSSPMRAYAQDIWPPLQVKLRPRYEGQNIIYDVTIRREVSWELHDITLKIPLPKGTRLLETNVPPGNETDFDGQEVIFFIPQLNEASHQVSFIVEITDPQLTVFATQAWFTWQGKYPGDYLAKTVSFDINQQPLEWSPPRYHFQITMTATLATNIITYRLYPKVIDLRRRISDVSIKVPIPAGTNFLSAEAPPSFTYNSDGREVSFFSMQFRPQDEFAGPLIIRVSAPLESNSVVVTHAWATWKNDGPGVGTKFPFQEELVTGDIFIKPPLRQIALSDATGEIPFANYDLASLTFQETGSTLIADFHTVGDIGPIGQPLAFTLFIDSDCNSKTGELKNGRGVEYQIFYNHRSGQATLVPWEQTQNNWLWSQSTKLDSSIGEQMVTVSIPRESFVADQSFCWVGRALNGTPAFYPAPPGDWLPSKEYSDLTNYEFEIPLTPFSSTRNNITQQTRPASSPLENIKGKLAIPVINEWDFYDVHIFSLPGGEEIAQIQNARHPNFGPDGQRLLINRQRGYAEIHKSNSGNQIDYVIEYRDAVENIAEFNLDDGTLSQISSTPQDAYPFYNPQGSQIIYERSTLMVGTNGPQQTFGLIQCALDPVQLEPNQKCQKLSNFERLVRHKHLSGLSSSYPLWASSETIVYRSCSNITAPMNCGIYITGLQDIQASNSSVTPVQLVEDPTAIPSDTHGELIAYTSRQDGNWEAYVMSLDGTNIRNLSESSVSNDGLPTISSDGEWVAFVSDRSGEWAVWVVPLNDDSPQKLFNLPEWTPWGNGEQAWTNERISWGP